MNPDLVLRTFASGAMVICAVFAVLNLARIPKRGIRSAGLAVAFLAFGVLAYAYAYALPMAVQGGALAVVVIGLVIDFVNRPPGPPR